MTTTTRGRPKKIVTNDEELSGHEAVQYTIAEILQARCGIAGCQPKHHTEEAGIILRKMIKLDLLKDE